MMVRMAAQKNHAARHHLFRVDIGDSKAQYLGVESGGSFEVAYPQDNMAELGDMKVHSLGRRHTF
jgi:hypothetical protein